MIFNPSGLEIRRIFWQQKHHKVTVLRSAELCQLITPKDQKLFPQIEFDLIILNGKSSPIFH